jgi:predicted nucleotidyltransferase
MNSFGLLKNDLYQIVEIMASNKKVKSIILFGSRAKGNFSPGSDIDIALKGNTLDLSDIIDMKVQIDQTSLPYKIDIIIYDRITELMLKNHIDRVGIQIYPDI